MKNSDDRHFPRETKRAQRKQTFHFKVDPCFCQMGRDIPKIGTNPSLISAEIVAIVSLKNQINNLGKAFSYYKFI